MGKVMLNGLERMENVVKMIYDSPVLPKNARNYVKRISEARERIKVGMDRGGYLPHYVLDSVVEMNYRMRGLMEAKDVNSKNKAVETLIGRIETMIPDQAKGRNENINNIWAKSKI